MKINEDYRLLSTSFCFCCQSKIEKLSNTTSCKDLLLIWFWFNPVRRTLKPILRNSSLEKRPLWTCFEIYPSSPACTVTTSPGNFTVFLHNDMYNIINMFIKQRNSWRKCPVCVDSFMDDNLLMFFSIFIQSFQSQW